MMSDNKRTKRPSELEQIACGFVMGSVLIVISCVLAWAAGLTCVPKAAAVAPSAFMDLPSVYVIEPESWVSHYPIVISLTGRADVDYSVSEYPEDQFLVIEHGGWKMGSGMIEIRPLRVGLSPRWFAIDECTGCFESDQCAACACKLRQWRTIMPFEIRLTPRADSIEGDLDSDGDVDLKDFADFQNSFTGPKELTCDEFYGDSSRPLDGECSDPEE